MGELSSMELEKVAIIGVAGRFPGARNPAEFWNNVAAGVDSISRFDVDELEVQDPRKQCEDPDYVRARGVLADVDLFDAAFFGIQPRDAKLMDPQHRVFLECCWEALEDSGRDPLQMSETAGVFAGCSQNSYFLNQVSSGRPFLREYAEAYQVGHYATMLGTITDTLATRVSYKLNLTGPSIALSCACSTSLVAVSQACASLLSYQCDMALAGGVSISFPQKRGYLYQAGGMVSPDGRCRTFDAQAQGTVFGSGAGVVVLKRLADAIADGDHVYAVILGSAVNNDGSGKVGFTAPSAAGQAKVIAVAQALANVDPRSISYIEAHGTATPLGDPIEIEALTQVFRQSTKDRRFCAIGTGKPNVGHLDVASGITGLIKTALSLEKRTLPPQLHFETPNPELNLGTSPFYVNTELRAWKSEDGVPLRAGVSAFGVGGTNCHVVLEEAPALPSGVCTQSPQLLVISAKTPGALQQAKANLAEFLQKYPNTELERCAFTLQTGRTPFRFRSATVCRDSAEAIGLLSAQPARVTETPATEPAIYFLFPGQGSQYPGMGRELYETQSVFRETVDRCVEILKRHLGVDLRMILFPDNPDSLDAVKELRNTRFAQPATFVVEYALAALWSHWGIRPTAMVGHSVGEFVCACLAGVFSLDDVLAIVAIRAQWIADLPEGAMLAVRLTEEDLVPQLSGELSVAAVNGPRLTVVAGPMPAILALQSRLKTAGVSSVLLNTSHAFHSPAMDPILEPLARKIDGFPRSAPTIPYVSCVTGDWITQDLATDSVHWANHCRGTVRFLEALRCLPIHPGDVVLEVGAGTTLRRLARQSLDKAEDAVLLSSLSDAPEGTRASDSVAILESLGKLWMAGVQPHWQKLHDSATPGRISIPTYPFERKRHWIEQPETPVVPIAVSKSEPAVAPQQNTEVSMVVNQEEQAPLPNGNLRAVPALIGILEELSGLGRAEIAPEVSFLELGFDSLFLTQFAQAIVREFKVKITFRQLLTEISSVRLLAQYLEPLFPEIAPVLPSPSPAKFPVAETVQTDAASSMERIMKDQLDAMSRLVAQQLAILHPAAIATEPEVSVAAQSVLPNEPKFIPFKPVQTSTTTELTPVQRDYISSLTRRYTGKTGESKRLAQRYRRVLADPRVVSGFRPQWKEMVYPLVVNRSKGSQLWDVDGNEYIDLLNGFGSIAFGHRPDFVTAAVSEQLTQGIEIGPQTPLAGPVAELLCELTGMERATFCNTGSEAVMAALRLARTVTGRKLIVLFAGGYHGNFEEVLVKRTGRGGSLRSGPIAPGIAAEAVANVIVLDYGSPEALQVIRERAHQLAAVLVEPVQSRHPELRPLEFLREVRRITAESGTALIFDEIVTGFRVHQGGGQAMYGIQADLATYGKVLGGGLPIGAVAGKAAFMDALDGGFWSYGDDSCPETGMTFFAGTFVRHPLALAAALAVLQHLKESGASLQDDLTRKTEDLVGKLNAGFARYGVPSEVRTCGSWFYFSFAIDFAYGSLLFFELRERGIHLLEGFPCFLTSAHSELDLERIAEAFDASCKAMRAGGMWPDRERLTAPALPSDELAITEAPLIEAQLEIWLSTQLGSEASCAYNESFCIRFDGPLDTGLLAESLQQVIARHDALRATFDPSGTLMRFAPAGNVSLPVNDLSFYPADEAEAQLTARIEADASTPFDLIHGPVFRAELFRTNSTHHVLAFTAHHIVCDGWSVNILVEELSQIYSARRAGNALTLPTALSYGTYATGQRSEAGSAQERKVEEYWLKRFAVPAPVLDLPVDRPRPALKSYAGSTYRHAIGRELYSNIKRSGSRRGATLMATLLAGFESLLFRLSGQYEVVVGIPAAAQSLLEGQTLVGHCVNFLPLRSTREVETTFAQLLDQTRESLLDAYDHQTYTFGTLVRKLDLKRSPSRLPLIEVQFNLERVGGNFEFQDLQTKVNSNPKAAVNFDLFLNVVESPDGLILDCDYNRDLFDRATIARWMGHYSTLLAEFVKDPACLVAKLPLLNPGELQELVVEQNRTQADYPRNRRIHELFEEQAARTPQATAVTFGDGRLTYSQLNARADRLARYLSKHGAGPGMTVGIYLERSLSVPEVLLAVLKTGAAYVPLDPALPVERTSMILDAAGPGLLISQEREALPLAPVAIRVICLDTERKAVEKESEAAFHLAGSSQDAAYVIFTSGSTGKPKGVEVTHRSVVNFLASMQKQPGLSAADKLLAVTTLSFDIAGLEMFLPLVTGAQVVIANRDTTMSGRLLADTIQRCGITVLQATPVTWRLLLEAGWQAKPGFRMLCGGEALPRPLANRLLASGQELWNLYGPTETTIWSAAGRVFPGDIPVLIAAPIANTQFYVLDGLGQFCPFGVTGELHIGGDGVAAGYYRQPALTREKFIPDPFQTDPGARLYKSGDLVRKLPSGEIEFLGRLDHQVKIRGFRIELGEIEAVISQHAGVREVAVFLQADNPGQERLIAYLVGDADQLPTERTLREFLNAKLPSYMVPAHFAYLAELPRTANGKIDVRALHAVPTSLAVEAEGFVAPRSAVEERLAKIAAEVLQLTRVSVEDSLFELGADSLRIFQIASRAQNANIPLTAQHLLQGRTLAAASRAASEELGASSIPPKLRRITRASRESYRIRETNPVAVKPLPRGSLDTVRGVHEE